MKAARWHGIKDVRLEDVAEPTPRPDEAVVRVLWVGLCGSDLEEFESGPVVAHPGVVLGHEIVGQVITGAADGSGPRIGTTVIVDVVVGCGSCFWCVRHEEGLCPCLQVIGLSRDGGLTERLAARASRLVAVPDSVPARHAALTEPLAVAVRAVRKCGSMFGQSVIVVGGGTIGMLTAQVARGAGAARVVVVEPEPRRRALLESWGISAVWEDDEAERAACLGAMLPGRGSDFVIECSGRPGVARESVRLVRPGGRAVLVGVPTAEQQLDVLDIVLGEKVVVGSAGHVWDEDIMSAVGLLAAGVVDVAPMISHELPLRDVADAFALLADPARPVLKLLVDCAT